MREKENARWVCEHRHMGGWGQGVGTVLAWCRCTGKSLGRRVNIPIFWQEMLLGLLGLGCEFESYTGCNKKGSEKRKDGDETNKQEDAMGENKSDRTGKGFVATDSSKKEYKGSKGRASFEFQIGS
uniref:Uncharacterized protein n=1 Tax=Tanacetum cinerariifolium TaxID=118510 RepID=A0A6L2MT92_TANCI|nr:hypothetical protein [Tanacetum cinerariifolium]